MENILNLYKCLRNRNKQLIFQRHTCWIHLYIIFYFFSSTKSSLEIFVHFPSDNKHNYENIVSMGFEFTFIFSSTFRLAVMAMRFFLKDIGIIFLCELFKQILEPEQYNNIIVESGKHEIVWSGVTLPLFGKRKSVFCKASLWHNGGLLLLLL